MSGPRKLNARDAKKHELEAFAEKYDTLADIYGDPVEVVFKIMADADDANLKLQAAGMLMSYRYPRIKSMEQPKDSGPMFQLTVVQNNLPGPTAPPSIDITPNVRDLIGD